MEDNLVNFDKLRMISYVLKDIMTCQYGSYPFEKDSQIQAYLSQAIRLGDSALMKYSLLCEPQYGTERHWTELSEDPVSKSS